MGASLGRVDAVVVVGLRDVQRLAVSLATRFDGVHSEVLGLEVALGLDPVYSAGISE